MLLIVSCTVPMASISASAEEVESVKGYFTITDPYFPSALTESYPRAIGGIINSENNLLSVSIEVWDVDGGIILSAYSDVLPLNTKTYDLSKLDNQLHLNLLKPGNYIFDIYIDFWDDIDSDYKTFTLTVNPASFSSTNIGYPTSITQGRGFPVTGTVRSTGNITKVWVGAYSSSTAAPDSYIVGASETISVFSYVQGYNLANLDSKVVFNNLSKGTYYYKVMVELSSGTRYTYINRAFTVV